MTPSSKLVRALRLLLILGAGGATSPALAECPEASIFFGNLDGGHIELNLLDPGAFFRTYIFEDPRINEGSARLRDFAFDGSEFGFPPGSALIFADWAGTEGLEGCPDSLDVDGDHNLEEHGIHQVFAFGDARGVTLAVVSPDFRDFNLDAAAAPGASLVVSRLRARPLSQRLVPTGIQIEMEWPLPTVNADPASLEVAARLIQRYRLIEVAARDEGGTSERELVDLDLEPGDNRATVILPIECAVSTLVVEIQLASAGGSEPAASVRAALMEYDKHYNQFCGEFPEADCDEDRSPFCTDCNDFDLQIYPGAPERCTEYDDNCNGRLDDFAFSGDADRDGEVDYCDFDDGLILLESFRDIFGPRLWQWSPERVDWFNLYRGSLAVLRDGGLYTQDPALTPDAARFCGLTGNYLEDPFVPGTGGSAFYLVTGTLAGVEGSLGTNSRGGQRPNDSPCP